MKKKSSYQQHVGDLEGITLSEICQKEKDERCMISVMFGIWKHGWSKPNLTEAQSQTRNKTGSCRRGVEGQSRRETEEGS